MLLSRRRQWGLLSILLATTGLFLFYTAWVRQWSPRIPISEVGLQIKASGKAAFDWASLPQHHPVSTFIALPSGAPATIPTIQDASRFQPEDAAAQKVRLQRLAAVKEAFEHAWSGYKKRAWMKDELAPVSGGWYTTFGGWAATLVDSLDTLWIMGLHEEFDGAVRAVATIDFSMTDGTVLNVFETTIRYLGGLLGAYDISNGRYPVLLVKAVELGDMLYTAFDTPNRMPVTRWSWKLAAQGQNQEAAETTLVSELGSLALEFTRLSQLTHDNKYFDAVQRITNELNKAQKTTKLPGMWPIVVNARVPSFDSGNQFTLGGMSDSLYEYLVKEYLLLGGLSPQYREMYEGSLETIKKHLLFQPMTDYDHDVLFSGSAIVMDQNKTRLEPKVQHLGCFAGGMVGIGAKVFNSLQDLPVARKLVDGCIWAYENSTSGLMPEIFHAMPCTIPCHWWEHAWFHAIAGESGSASKDSRPDHQPVQNTIREKRLQPGITAVDDRRYILRPEAIESIFIFYRITGERMYLDKAWIMFEAIQKHTRTALANAALDDVTVENPPKADRMESFWLAETLKYFYLIFSDPSVVSLDDYVLNTEAHPLRRPH